MRDPRLLQAWNVARATELAATEQFLAMVTTTPDRTEIDLLLAEWWTGVLAQDSPGDEWETAQVEYLRTRCSSLPAGSQQFGLAALSTLARNEKDEDRGVGAVLLGESAAAVVRKGSSAVALDRAVRFLSECWEAIEVMIERLTQAPVWPGVLEIVRPVTTDVARLLGHHFGRLPSHEVLLEEDRKARERGVLAYFWGHHTELCLNETTIVRLKLLARQGWSNVALQADALPYRGLQDDLWQHLNLHQDRDSIRALLGAAPAVILDDEWTGSTSALAALRAATQHADRLHDQLAQNTRNYRPTADAHEKLRAFIEHEVPEWMKEVSQAAMIRPDGRSLLLVFAASLTREALQPSWNGHRQWSCARHALSAIRDVLDPKPSVGELQRVARLAGVPGNDTTIDHATYLVTSAAFHAFSNDVWVWYRELLLKSDDGLCWQAKNWRRALCYEALAERLGQLTAPFAEWRAVWNALFVTDREHSRFAPLDQNVLYPSLHLLRVGAELLRQLPSRSGARPFFDELLANTHFLLTNYARKVGPLEQELAVDAIDVAPRVMGSDWPQSLEAHRPMLSAAKNRLYVATLLLEGGAPFSDVEAAVEGAGRVLADSVTEIEQSKDFLNLHQLCESITAAAREIRTEVEP